MTTKTWTTIKQTVNEILSSETWLLDGQYHREDGPAVIKYRGLDKISEEWYLNGKRHRLDGPALIKYRPSPAEEVRQEEIEFCGHAESHPELSRKQTVALKEWYLDGQLNRQDGPAQIDLTDGYLKSETWYFNGKKHRSDHLPSEIRYAYDGYIYCQIWYRNGVPSREDDLPHCLEYRPNGQISGEIWYDSESQRHRDQDKPAGIWYHQNNTVSDLLWYQHGKLYRENKPALLHFRPDGQVEEEAWYLGKEIEERNPKNNPFHIWYYPNGHKKEERWRQDYTDDLKDCLTRRIYSEDGSIKSYRFDVGGLWIDVQSKSLNPKEEICCICQKKFYAYYPTCHYFWQNAHCISCFKNEFYHGYLNSILEMSHDGVII